MSSSPTRPAPRGAGRGSTTRRSTTTRPTASYIYEAHLRYELTRRLGVRWQQTRKGIAEIEGFADEHLRAFSTRRAEILEAAGENASVRSMQVATLATRKPKEADLGKGELLERWRSRAEDIGLDREAIERTFDPEAGLRVDAAVTRTVSTQQVDRAVTAGASHFDRRDAIQAVADSLRDGAPGAEVERLADAFLASDAVIQVAETAKGPRFTTRRIWELEREALAATERLRAEGVRPADELVAARVIASRPTLKADQREMIRRLLTSPEGVAVVIGEAGTGKTFAIVAAAEGLFDQGRNVKQVAEWLGHADPSFTLRTYVHLLDAGVGDATFFDEAIDSSSDQARHSIHIHSHSPATSRRGRI